MTEREEARKVFSTPEGQDYLIRLLKGMYVFDEVHDADQIASRNAGMRILKSLGMLDTGRIRLLVKYFFTLDVDRIEEEETRRNMERINSLLDGINPDDARK